jgi:enoyl-[acyl-carrier protein] reductase I
MTPSAVGRGTVSKKVALIMGVANQRSIAWSCVQSFLQQRPGVDWHVLLTYQHGNDKVKSKVQSLIDSQQGSSGTGSGAGRILGAFPCDVTDDAAVRTFFHEALPEALHRCYHQDDINHDDGGSVLQFSEPQLHAVIHSIAYAPDLKRPLLETTREAFLLAHEVSAYSLIQVARESLPYMKVKTEALSTSTNESTAGRLQQAQRARTCSTTSLTTLSYLGAARAIPGYNVMGPAKASLESIVRGLALEMGGRNDNSLPVRVNAIRAGPIPTLSSRGGIANFDLMRQDVDLRSSLGRNVTAEEVASTVYHVAAEAWGMTGQTIDVDGGYSSVMGPVTSV